MARITVDDDVCGLVRGDLEDDLLAEREALVACLDAREDVRAIGHDVERREHVRLSDLEVVRRVDGGVHGKDAIGRYTGGAQACQPAVQRVFGDRDDRHLLGIVWYPERTMQRIHIAGESFLHQKRNGPAQMAWLHAGAVEREVQRVFGGNEGGEGGSRGDSRHEGCVGSKFCQGCAIEVRDSAARFNAVNTDRIIRS